MHNIRHHDVTQRSIYIVYIADGGFWSYCIFLNYCHLMPFIYCSCQDVALKFGENCFVKELIITILQFLVFY